MELNVIRGVKETKKSLFLGPLIVVKNIKEHSTLTKYMINKDIKLAYHGTFLGYLWTMIEPLLMTIILYMLFVILRGTSDEFLPLKVMLGILFFGCFSKTMSLCTNSLIRNSSLINQVYFPRELFQISVVGYQIYRLLMSLIIVIPVMIWYKVEPTIFLVFLIPAIIGVSMLGLGLGMIASILQVRIRDISQLVQVILRASFFISGVFYGAEHVPEKWLHVHFLNPVAVFIELSRTAVFGEWGALEIHNIIYALSISLLILLLGMGIFKRYEQGVVKYI